MIRYELLYCSNSNLAKMTRRKIRLTKTKKPKKTPAPVAGVVPVVVAVVGAAQSKQAATKKTKKSCVASTAAVALKFAALLTCSRWPFCRLLARECRRRRVPSLMRFTYASGPFLKSAQEDNTVHRIRPTCTPNNKIEDSLNHTK